MTEQEYVEGNPHLFHHLHVHDGVWWDQIYPGYAKPAFKFRELVPHVVRPARSRSYWGYSHCVPEMRQGNHAVDYMVLEGDNLREFGMDRLDSKKRNQVKKGFKCCEVKEILELEPHLEDARAVCISHSQRGVQTRKAFHVSHTYFIDHAEAWRAQMRHDFAGKGRKWFGAWRDNRLIAYLVTLQVENTMIIEKMKLHTDFMQFCPSDALYFAGLEQAARTASCRRIVNSPPQRPGLDRFKEQFLFKPTPIPFYVSNLFLFRLGTGMMRLKGELRMRIKGKRENP